MSADWPSGVDRTVLEETDSTNSRALLARPPTWILAHRQTAARGRRGRPWSMPPGNFGASLAVAPAMPPARAALYSFVAALALHDVLSDLTPRRLELKWPNDVLLDGGKVAGILLESAGTATRLDRLAIGFGVNLVAPPDRVEPEATPPVGLAADVDAETFLDRLAPAFARREASFLEQGFAPLREAWLARAAHLGQPIVARTARESRTGVFADVDAATGALVLSTRAGREMVTAADVFF